MTVRTSPRPRAGTKGVARAEREAQILEAACRRFGEQGYVATSVEAVAADAGISKPLVYSYFGSKDGLYAACVREATRVLLAELERTTATGTVGLPRALLTLDGMFHALAERRWLWRLVFDPGAPREGDVAAARAAYETRIEAIGREGVAAVLAAAGHTDPDDVAATRAAWEAIFRALVTWWVEHPDETPEAMTRRCVRLFAAVFAEVDVDAVARHALTDLGRPAACH